jgi:hypothetical protein
MLIEAAVRTIRGPGTTSSIWPPRLSPLSKPALCDDRVADSFRSGSRCGSIRRG